jgi:hypothetical protein
MRVIVEQLVEWRLAGETEVLGENLNHSLVVLFFWEVVYVEYVYILIYIQISSKS